MINSIQANNYTLPIPRDSLNNVVYPDESDSSIEQVNNNTELTDLAQITMTSHITDFSYSETRTSFAYYKDDHSMALKASSETNIKTHEETYTFDITFSAESLGLKEEDFKDGKPKYLNFTYEKKEINVDYLSSLQVQNTVRSAADVLSDLAKAIRDVMKGKGNKTVAYVLDAEARQALLSDPEVGRLATQLIMLMAMINLSKKEGPASHYLISVSGKGKPVANYQESINIESNSKTVNLNIKINPPGASLSEESEIDIESNEPAAADLETTAGAVENQ